MDTDPEWEALQNTVVLIGGTEKRFGDCSREDLDELIFDAVRDGGD
jgi:hypothetical protein